MVGGERPFRWDVAQPEVGRYVVKIGQKMVNMFLNDPLYDRMIDCSQKLCFELLWETNGGASTNSKK